MCRFHEGKRLIGSPPTNLLVAGAGTFAGLPPASVLLRSLRASSLRAAIDLGAVWTRPAHPHGYIAMRLGVTSATLKGAVAIWRLGPFLVSKASNAIGL